MTAPRATVSRVVLVVLDGVRADAAPLFAMRQLQALAARGAASFTAQTVSPSVTAAAMASLLTGVRPEVHGLIDDRVRIPLPRRPLAPLPRVFAAAGIPTRVYLAAVPWAYRGIARRLTRLVGVHDARFRGQSCADILDGARDAITTERRGLFLLHWPDADRAGHAHGWTSRPYMHAVRRLDESLGALASMAGVADDPETLLIALADHGGGGREFRDHESPHPHDRTIPLVLGGGAVARGELAPLTSLLDVPPTILAALGVEVPASYEGRVLVEAFAQTTPPIAACA